MKHTIDEALKNAPPQIIDFLNTLEEQNKLKEDIVVRGNEFSFNEGNIILFHNNDFGDRYQLTDLAHAHMAESFGIPNGYYKLMREAFPELLDINVSKWIDRSPEAKYLIRAWHKTPSNPFNYVRAILSDRFHILDHHELFFTAIQAINEMGVEFRIAKAEITPKKMHVHVVCDGFAKDTEFGPIHAGFIITNSEVGVGTFEIAPRMMVMHSGAGYIDAGDSYKRVHLGATLPVGLVVHDEHRKTKNVEIVRFNIQQAIRKFLHPEYVAKMVERAQVSHNIQLSHPIDAMQQVCRELPLSDQERADVLRNFLQDPYGNTVAGIFHAIILKAQYLEPDQQFEIEALALSYITKAKKFDNPYKK